MTIPDDATTHDCYDPAMKITDQAEADAYFAALVRRCMRNFPDLTEEHAREIERTNLGYWAGYYSPETRSRVERLFDCAHPYFGKIDVNGPPTPERVSELVAQKAALRRAEISDPENSGF